MTLNRHHVLLFLSAICFAIAVLIALATATFKYSDALVPAGLLFFVLAHL